MTHTLINKRRTCCTCLRPQRTCICHWITRTEHAVELLILQHPLEVANAKGSARLLHLSLPHSRLVIGEAFPEQALRALLYDAMGPRLPDNSPQEAPKHTILLYPETAEAEATGMSKPAMLDEAALQEPAQIRLVILDGTWRKSRKMLHTNPQLQQLPRLSLHDTPVSQYLIRKAHGVHQLSTLEATCYALMQLEKNNAKYEPLLAAFNGFVAQQLAYCAKGKLDDSVAGGDSPPASL